MFLRFARTHARARALPGEPSCPLRLFFPLRPAAVLHYNRTELPGGIVAQISALFWDIGGVLLTNAWDHNERREAVTHFGLEAEDFERRHSSVVADFETGKSGLQQYLAQTVFYQERQFTGEAFTQFMFSRSQPKPDVLALARQISATGKYLLATINNESTELNEYRIEQFKLDDIFDLFVSSCFVGLRKPAPEIYQLALNLTQRAPAECCFIDDRPENLQPAAQLGMHAIRMQGVAQLENELTALGVKF